eukprot:13336457-Alexandrium_andersonii.AAC.1
MGRPVPDDYLRALGKPPTELLLVGREPFRERTPDAHLTALRVRDRVGLPFNAWHLQNALVALFDLPWLMRAIRCTARAAPLHG